MTAQNSPIAPRLSRSMHVSHEEGSPSRPPPRRSRRRGNKEPVIKMYTRRKNLPSKPSKARSFKVNVPRPFDVSPTQYTIYVDENGGWFRDPKSMSNFKKFYGNKSLAPCHLFDDELYAKEPHFAMDSFLAHSWGNLLDPGTIIYPRLLKLFYANLVDIGTKGEIVLYSIVKGVVITLDSFTLGLILGELCPPNDIFNGFNKSFKNECAKEFYLENSTIKTQAHLTTPARFIHAFINRILCPVGESSITTVNLTTLCMVYCILYHRKFDFHVCMLGHMRNAVSTSRDRALPYANWLTKVFDYFGVDTNGEDAIITPTPMITKATFKNLGLYWVPSLEDPPGDWKINEELSEEERVIVNAKYGTHLVAHTPEPPQPPPQEDKVDLILDNVLEMRGEMEALWAYSKNQDRVIRALMASQTRNPHYQGPSSSHGNSNATFRGV